jgi:tetratricopeptide (TPR) repeat protein
MRIRVSFGRLGLAALALLLCGGLAWSQNEARQAATPERIAEEVKKIEDAASWHATTDQLGILWGWLAADYQEMADVQRAEKAYTHALALLHESRSAQRSYASALDGLGALYLETGRMAESENCRRKALAILEAEGDSFGVSAVHGHLGINLAREGRYKDAEREASEALAGMLGRKDANAGEVVSVLITRAYARCIEHHCADGLADAKQAMEMIRAIFPADSLEAAAALIALGYALWKTGDEDGGGDAMRESLRLLREKTDVPQAALAGSRLDALREYALYLHQTHRKDEQRQVEREIAQIQSAQPQVCHACTVSVVGLANGSR